MLSPLLARRPAGGVDRGGPPGGVAVGNGMGGTAARSAAVLPLPPSCFGPPGVARAAPLWPSPTVGPRLAPLAAGLAKGTPPHSPNWRGRRWLRRDQTAAITCNMQGGTKKYGRQNFSQSSQSYFKKFYCNFRLVLASNVLFCEAKMAGK